MCAKPFSLRSFATSILLIPALALSSAEDYRYIDVPGELVDAEINGAGDVFLLLRGLPHLTVVRPDGSVFEFDLEEMVVPAGMCVDQGWGWYTTGEVTEMVYRYDRNGVLAESREAGTIPGDIAAAGLAVMYVSRTDGTIRSLRDPDSEVARLRGSGEGQLVPFGSRFVYSDHQESMVLGEYQSPGSLPGGAVWSAMGDTLVALTDSCICSMDGQVLFMIPVDDGFTRMSFSSGGGRCVLWSPGGERVMVPW